MQLVCKPSTPPALKVGQRVELQLDDACYATRLEELEADQLTIAWPTDRERQLVRFQTGQRLQLALSAEDARYSAPVVVVMAALRQQPVPLATIRLDGPWQRAQRRNDVRASVAIRPRLAERVVGDARQPLRAGLIDLSAGGVRLRSQDQLRHGETVALVFELMDVPDELSLMARVERIERADRGALPVWEAGCAFVQLTPRTATQIVQFIFAQQRALARARRS